MGRSAGLAARVEALLQRHWWAGEPTALAQVLRPLSWLYGWLAGWMANRQPAAAATPRRRAPLLVIGNITAGGGGKTPTVIALVQAFQAAGRRPGVVSRGYGRIGSDVRQVSSDDSPAVAGDEPLLIRRRTGVPVWVGHDRSAAAQALCRNHPEVDVLLADDGLQHQALHRDAELLVFDARGVGNALLLPAGPLRQPLPRVLQPHQRVLYTGGAPSAPLPGAVGQRSLHMAWPLQAWRGGHAEQAEPLAHLRGRTLLAVAGLAAPQRFFQMLQDQGLTIQPCPLPDHHPYNEVPWPADTTEVVTTEKDAVKLLRLPMGQTRVWVLPLDFELPPGLAHDLLALLPAPSVTPPP